MSNGPIKVTQLPIVTTAATTDRLLFLSNATGSANTATITMGNFTTAVFAQASNISVNQINATSVNAYSANIQFCNAAVINTYSLQASGWIGGIGGVGQLQAIGGTGSTFYNALLRNDGSSTYLLSSAVATTLAGATNLTFNSYRPFAWNLSSGAVTIDGTGIGVLFGGNTNTTGNMNAGSYTVGATFVANSSQLSASGNAVFTGKLTVGAITPTVDQSGIRTNGDIYMDNPVSEIGFNLYYASPNFYYRNTGYGYTIRSDNAGTLAIFGVPSGTAGATVSLGLPYFAINAAGVTVAGNTLTLGTSTKAANGYTWLTNGVKMNWGWVSANSTVGAVTFTSPFAVNAYSITATSNTTVATYGAAVTAWTNTTATILTGNATSTNVFWQAVGA